MALFGMGKKREAPASPEKTPVEDVLRLKQQGLNNNQVIQALQRSGYRTHQIFDAMNQAELGLGGHEMSQPAQEPFETEPLMPSAEQPMQEPMQPEYGQMQQGYQAGYQAQAPEEQVEELVEAIINEKWKEVEKDIKKIIEWKAGIESRMKGIEQKADDLTQQFNALHTAVLSKVSEYDKNIVSVGTEIKAMESVFRKVLPAFTENVNKLSRITRDAGKKK